MLAQSILPVTVTVALDGECPPYFSVLAGLPRHTPAPALFSVPGLVWIIVDDEGMFGKGLANSPKLFHNYMQPPKKLRDIFKGGNV